MEQCVFFLSQSSYLGCDDSRPQRSLLGLPAAETEEQCGHAQVKLQPHHHNLLYTGTNYCLMELAFSE